MSGLRKPRFKLPRQMNDDQSALTTLISCVPCAKTMRIERIDPDGDGRDIIQYRREHCGQTERLRLVRRTWPHRRGGLAHTSKCVEWTKEGSPAALAAACAT